MKSILTLLLVAGTLYLSSCTKTDTPVTNVPLTPKADSVTKGGFFQISFNGESYMIHDLVVQRVPVYSLYAFTMASNQQDTLYIAQIQLTDHQAKTISVDLTLYNNTSDASIGTYLVTTNNCTLTDYSEGQNRTYSVSLGSSVTLTNTDYTTEGTLSLNLYYNHVNYPATGSFKIYN